MVARWSLVTVPVTFAAFLKQASAIQFLQQPIAENAEDAEGAKCQKMGWGCDSQDGWTSTCCAGLFCDPTREDPDEDGDGTCQSVDAPLCMNENVLKFETVNTDDNSILTVEDVLPTVENDPIDLQIVNDEGYEPNDESKNGVEPTGRFVMLNFKTGTTAVLTFRFVNRNTGEQVIPHPFYFTVFDIDQEKDGGGRESVTVPDASHFARDRSTTVTTEDGITFSSSAYGSEANNPAKNPLDLVGKERKAMVSFEMPAISKFTVTVSVAASSTGEEKGRNVFFAGASSLTCAPGENRQS